MFEGASSTVGPQLKFQELQLEDFVQGIFGDERANSDTPAGSGVSINLGIWYAFARAYTGDLSVHHVTLI